MQYIQQDLLRTGGPLVMLELGKRLASGGWAPERKNSSISDFQT